MSKPTQEKNDLSWVNQFMSQVESLHSKYRETHKRPENLPPARDLTDAELRVLHASYVSGMKKMTNHPFNDDSGKAEYWKKTSTQR